MSDTQYGVPVTYVTDPPVTAGANIIQGGTVAVQGYEGQYPVQVFVQGGTIGATFSFIGSVTTDIGNVKIEDADDNYAVIPDASVAKDGNTNALVVQHIDDTGTPLRESTQVAISVSGSNSNDLLANIDLNTLAATTYLAEIANTQGTQSTALLATIANQQGTLATSANQRAEILHLEVIHSNQGTQATSANQTTEIALLSLIDSRQGTQSTAGLATTALQTTGNAIATVIMNNEGTLATSAAQTAQNLLLAAIDSHQGTQATSANQTDEIAKLAAILTAQGTQSTAGLARDTVLIQVMNNQGTLTPGAVSSPAQTVTMNNQGTLATSDLQTVGNSTLNNILTALQSTSTSSSGTNLEATLFNAVYTPGNSAAVNVNGYTEHSIQHIITNGSVAHYTQTSLDGINWNLESNDFTSCIVRLTGACKYIRAVYTSGNGTLTSLLNSAKATGSGGPSNGQGPAESLFSGSISGTVGSTYTLPVNGASSIGFHYVPPTGSWTIFEGSWDGVHWTDMTLRQMGAHGYSTRTDDSHQDWIGSISTWNYFRLRIVTGGSGIGTLAGRTSFVASTLEGMENSPMPHRIGAAVESRGFSYSAAVSNGTIWAPVASDHRLYISDIHFTVDANTTVTFSDGSYAQNFHIFRGGFKPPSGTSQYVPISFSLPHVFSGANRPLMITSTATANVEGVVHGYEAE